jgi:putative membrane protein
MTEEPAPSEPDYRFTLANERTYLAWVRTSLALVASGIGVIALGGRFSTHGGRFALGCLLVLPGAGSALAAHARWRAYDRAIRAQQPLPRPRALHVIAAGLTVAAALALGLAVASH